jgi:hypothetical protein
VLTDVRGIPAELTPVLPADGLHAEAVDDFVATVRSGAWSDAHGDHLLTRSTIVEAAYASAAQHREVVIDPA